MSSGLHQQDVVPVGPGEDAPVETPPCPVCDGQRARPRFALPGRPQRLVVCEGCGLGSLFPLPDAQELAGYYPPDYYGSPGQKFRWTVELGVRLVAARQVHFLTRHLRPGARVLDVGCGRGVLLSTLAARGFEVHGQEVCEAAARGADPRARIRIAPDLAGAGYEPDSFDLVILWHVLEHLPDPRGTLEEVARLLRPGGQVAVALPNLASWQARWAGPGWFHLDPPRHLFHFTADSLRRLLIRCGLEPRGEHHFSLRQNPFGWVQSALNRLGALPRNSLYELLHERPPGEPLPFDGAVRTGLRLAWLAGMPLGLGLSVLEAALRNGATVCLLGRKPVP